MNKLLAVATLGTLMVGLTARPASAFYPRCYKSCFTYSVHCRPYNAFSPCAFGQVYYDGCVPPPGYFGAPYPCGTMGAYNPAMMGNGCANGVCGAGMGYAAAPYGGPMNPGYPPSTYGYGPPMYQMSQMPMPMSQWYPRGGAAPAAMPGVVAPAAPAGQAAPTPPVSVSGN